MKPVIFFLALFLAPLGSAHAIDPGRVEGTLKVNGKDVALTHAYAHRHDNAEGLLDHAKELRILLADREVEQSALVGLAFLPVSEMAEEGRLRGWIPTSPRRPS